jgi:hypothetical protein
MPQDAFTTVRLNVEENQLVNVKDDTDFRRVTAEQAGVGFHVPTVAAKLPVAPGASKSEVGNFSASARKEWCALRDSNSRPSGS